MPWFNIPMFKAILALFLVLTMAGGPALANCAVLGLIERDLQRGDKQAAKLRGEIETIVDRFVTGKTTKLRYLGVTGVLLSSSYTVHGLALATTRFNKPLRKYIKDNRPAYGSSSLAQYLSEVIPKFNAQAAPRDQVELFPVLQNAMRHKPSRELLLSEAVFHLPRLVEQLKGQPLENFPVEAAKKIREWQEADAKLSPEQKMLELQIRKLKLETKLIQAGKDPNAKGWFGRMSAEEKMAIIYSWGLSALALWFIFG